MAGIARDKTESTYHRLKELVVNYRFRPGEPLSPMSIADRLHVSATPVREALARLHGEDLVDLTSNRGFFAKTLNEKKMSDLYEFAFQISIHALEHRRGEFIMEMIRPENSIVRGGVLANHETDETLVCFAKFIEGLYIHIAALSGNGVMLNSIRNFNDQTRFVRLIYLETENNLDEITLDMTALISALERQDVTAAMVNLRHQRDKKLARMNDLVREGIARSLGV
ncbi:GntR family transcriptional regulator [Mesorhizobium sp. ISC15]|uniref:GntR family transcriptional regulator n=1 Tax=Mesorhizobium sp. ISC15 TaxID=3076429 RepID=UPI00301C77C5